MTKVGIGHREFDKQIVCKYNHCENAVQDGDWMCNKHKNTEYIWKEKCLNCGSYHH